MHKDLERVLFDEEALKAKVAELGAALTEDYRGKDPLVVGILNGAMVFYADLIRQLKVPMETDFMRLSSYGSSSVSSENVQIKKDLDTDIKGRHIVLVEDIIDSGNTMLYLLNRLKDRGAASVKLCALFSKPSRRKVEVKIDYLGWEIPDEFIVGYGLDFAERYRNLPMVGVLKREVYE